MVPLMEIVTNVLRMHPGTGMDTVFEKIYGEDLTAMSFRGHVMWSACNVLALGQINVWVALKTRMLISKVSASAYVDGVEKTAASTS